MENHYTYDDFDLQSQFVNHLKTDKVITSIDSVLISNGNPIGFTQRIMEHNQSKLFDRYAKNISEQYPSLVPILRDGWVYEQVFKAAIDYRMVCMFPDDEKELRKRRIDAMRAIMLVYDKEVPASKYAGFFYFSKNMYNFFSSYPTPTNADRFGLTRRLVSTIGSILEPNWIFHNQTWFKTLDCDIQLFNVLRGFVQISSSNVFYSDEAFEHVYDFDIAELLDHMETFIDLRESDDTTPQNIRKFVESVEHYALEIPVPSIYPVLYGGSFSTLHSLIESQKIKVKSL
jgi:hypothetical protein